MALKAGKPLAPSQTHDKSQPGKHLRAGLGSRHMMPKSEKRFSDRIMRHRDGLSRESLYKALSAEGNPEFSTVIRVMQALGLRFSVTVAEPR